MVSLIETKDEATKMGSDAAVGQTKTPYDICVAAVTRAVDHCS